MYFFIENLECVDVPNGAFVQQNNITNAKGFLWRTIAHVALCARYIKYIVEYITILVL